MGQALLQTLYFVVKNSYGATTTLLTQPLKCQRLCRSFTSIIAVSTNPDMASIGSFEATTKLINASANALTFNVYYETILDAAQHYNTAHAPQSGHSQKFVNSHDIAALKHINFLNGGDDDLWYPEPNNLLAYPHQKLSNFAHKPNANSHFKVFQALENQQWKQFQQDPNNIPGTIWRQLPSWARTALQEKDCDQQAQMATQTTLSNQRKGTFTDQHKQDTNSSESLEQELCKWVLEHDCKERVLMTRHGVTSNTAANIQL